MGDVVPFAADQRPELSELTLATLDAVGEQFDRYIVFPSQEARDAVVLWALHCHVFDSFDSTPRLSLRSKEPGSGKSRVLEILNELVPRPLLAVRLTPGVLWRKIEYDKPVIMQDEADKLFGKRGSSTAYQEQQSIFNAGHRKGATVPRCVGSEDVKEFNVFCPVAFAGIGRLPETIASRSVEIIMRKRRAGDPDVRPFRLRFAADELAYVKAMMEMWAVQAAKPLSRSLPDLPVTDRQADVWEPLVAIADMASEEWGRRARVACLKLTQEANEQPASIGVQLLGDIRAVFGDGRTVATSQLVSRLGDLDENPWQEMSGQQISRILTEYDIRQTTVRVPDAPKPVKGYRRSDFSDAWSKFLAPEETDDDD